MSIGTDVQCEVVLPRNDTIDLDDLMQCDDRWILATAPVYDYDEKRGGGRVMSVGEVMYEPQSVEFTSKLGLFYTDTPRSFKRTPDTSKLSLKSASIGLPDTIDLTDTELITTLMNDNNLVIRVFRSGEQFMKVRAGILIENAKFYGIDIKDDEEACLFFSNMVHPAPIVDDLEDTEWNSVLDQIGSMEEPRT